MALSLLSEEMRLGNRGKAQNYNVGEGSTAGNGATASKHQNIFVSTTLSHRQSTSGGTANLACLLSRLFKPLLTRQYESQSLGHAVAWLSVAFG